MECPLQLPEEKANFHRPYNAVPLRKILGHIDKVNDAAIQGTVSGIFALQLAVTGKYVQDEHPHSRKSARTSTTRVLRIAAMHLNLRGNYDRKRASNSNIHHH